MTLRDLRDNGDTITLHCATYLEAQGRWCSKAWEPGFDQLIQYFGLDFEISADRARFLAMFECPDCGARPHSLTWGINAPGMHRGFKTHPAGDLRTAEEKEADRLEHLYIVERTDRQVREAQNNRKASGLAEKIRKARESGKDPIGPPNPSRRPKP